MNKLLTLAVISLLGSNFSHGIEPQHYSIFNSEQSIDNNGESNFQIPIERKVQRLLSCEKGIYKLPLDASYIRGTLVPEMEAERLVLAPHYPETNGVFGAAKEALITDWILNYESEYDQFVVYYETLVRSHS